MKLFNFKKQKTWQELKLEQEEAERIKNEIKNLAELNKQIELPNIDEAIKEINGLSEKELNKELKKYPRKNRKKLRELYIQYQKGLILQVGNNIDNKKYLAERA
jgi:hypothetical protein